jgi:hypothetical protein
MQSQMGPIVWRARLAGISAWTDENYIIPTHATLAMIGVIRFFGGFGGASAPS